jgi:hypothetical protein
VEERRRRWRRRPTPRRWPVGWGSISLIPSSILDLGFFTQIRIIFLIYYAAKPFMYNFRECAGVVALVSWRRDLHDLEVSYVGFIINACAEDVILAFGLQRYVTESLATDFWTCHHHQCA